MKFCRISFPCVLNLSFVYSWNWYKDTKMLHVFMEETETIYFHVIKLLVSHKFLCYFALKTSNFSHEFKVSTFVSLVIDISAALVELICQLPAFLT